MKRLKTLRVFMILAVLAPSAATVAGCQGGVFGTKAKPAPQAPLVSGKTTKAEVLRQLGEPDKTADLGKGKEELLYLRESTFTHNSWWHPTKSGFWVVLKNNVVESFGERSTVPDQNTHRLWPF